jgi:7-cyano-7-deazaguanine synthase in queuosine biosynthesis
MHTRALVLFSGGQDSTTCLAWALTRYSNSISFGQRKLVIPAQAGIQCRSR